ncbi:aldo/keto reductase [Endozoicomonas sp. 2B-B]
MNRFPLQIHIPKASRLIYGCMGLGGEWNNNPISDHDHTLAHNAVNTALECGINFFDHADIYTMGKAEQAFSNVIKAEPKLRQDLIIQSKCGIRFADDDNPGRYDLSPQWIEFSVNGILERLGTEYLDILLLHRPDPLMEPDLIAEAFTRLYDSGKVRHFGVSNMNQHQIAYLHSCIEQPLIVNQLPMSLARCDFVEDGILVAMSESADTGFTPGMIDYCRKNNVQLQAWGCLDQGLFIGKDTSKEPAAVQATAKQVAEMAEDYQTSGEAIALAWLMRHPASIQPVIGTTDKDRIRACSQAMEVHLSREDWYKLYIASRGQSLP